MPAIFLHSKKTKLMFGKKSKSKKKKSTKGMTITRPGDLPAHLPMYQHEVQLPDDIAAAIKKHNTELSALNQEYAKLKAEAQRIEMSKRQLLRATILTTKGLPDEDEITYTSNPSVSKIYVWENDKLPASKPTPQKTKMEVVREGEAEQK